MNEIFTQRFYSDMGEENDQYLQPELIIQQDQFGNGQVQINHRGRIVQTFYLQPGVYNVLSNDQKAKDTILQFVSTYWNQKDESIIDYAFKTGYQCIDNFLKSYTDNIPAKLLSAEKIASNSKLVQAALSTQEQFLKMLPDLEKTFESVTQQTASVNKRLVQEVHRLRQKIQAQFAPFVSKMTEQEEVKHIKAKGLFRRAKQNLKRITCTIDGLFQQLLIIFHSTATASFHQIWRTNQAIILNTLDTLKAQSKKSKNLMDVTRRLDLNLKQFNCIYLVVMAGVQALISCQLIVNSKFRLLYFNGTNNEFTHEQKMLHAKFKVLEKQAFAGAWFLFLLGRIYDRKSWTAQRKVELKRLALTQLTAWQLKYFSNFFQTVEKVEQQLKTKEPEKGKNYFKTYLWAALVGKGTDFFADVAHVAGAVATKIGNYLGFVQQSNVNQINIQVKKKQLVEQKISRQTKRLQQVIANQNNLDQKVLKNQIPIQQLKQQAEISKITQGQVLALANEAFWQRNSTQDVIQGGRILYEAANALNMGETGNALMSDKLISQQFSAVDERLMVEDVIQQEHQNKEENKIFKPTNVTKKKRNIDQKAEIARLKARNVWSSMGGMFDNKITIIINKKTTIQIKKILSGQVQIKQQIENFRKDAMLFLREKGNQLTQLKNGCSAFASRIQLMEKKRLLQSEIQQELSNKMIQYIENQKSSQEFLRQSLKNVEAKLQKQALSYDILAQGIQEIKNGSDVGAINISQNASKFLSQISFNAYATLSHQSIAELKTLIKATPETMIQNFNKNANELYREISNMQTMQKSQNKTILSGLSFLTSTVQVTAQQQQQKYDLMRQQQQQNHQYLIDTSNANKISLLRSFNQSLISQCGQVMSLVTTGLQDLKNYNIQTTANMEDTMNKIQQLIVQSHQDSSANITQIFNNLQSSFSKQISIVRSYQMQIIQSQKNAAQQQRQVMQSQQQLYQGQQQLYQGQQQLAQGQQYLSQGQQQVIQNQYQMANYQKNMAQVTQYYGMINQRGHQVSSIQNTVLKNKLEEINRHLVQKDERAVKQLQSQIEKYRQMYQTQFNEKNMFARQLNQAQYQIKQYKQKDQQFNQIQQMRKLQDQKISQMIAVSSRLATKLQLSRPTNITQLKSFFANMELKMQQFDLTEDSYQKKHIYEVASNKSKKDAQKINELKVQLAEIKQQLSQAKQAKFKTEQQVKKLRTKITQISQPVEITKVNEQVFEQIEHAIKFLESSLSTSINTRFYQVKTNYKNRGLNHMIDVIVSKMEILRQQSRLNIQNIQKKTTQLNHQITQLKLKVRSSQTDYRNMKMNYQEANSRRQNEEQNQANLKRKIAQLEKSRVTLAQDTGQIPKLSTQLKQLRVKYQEIVKQSKQNAQKSCQLNAEMSGKRIEISDLTNKLKKKSEQLQICQSKLDSKVNQLKKYEEVNNENQNKLKKVQKTLIKKNATEETILSVTGSKYIDIQDMVASLQKDIQILRRDNSNLNAEKSKFDKQMNSKSSQLSNFKNKYQNLQGKYHQQTKQSAARNLLAKTLQHKVFTLESDIRQSTKKIKDMEMKIEVLQSQKRKMTNQTHQAEVAAQKAQYELKTIKKELQKQSKSRQQISIELQDVRKDYQKMRKVVADMQKQAFQKQGIIKQKVILVQEIKKRLASMERQSEIQQKKIAESQAKLKQNKEELSQKNRLVDQLVQMANSVSLTYIATKAIRKKIAQVQIIEEQNKHEQLEKKMNLMVNFIRDVNKNYVNWNEAFRQIRMAYGLSEGSDIDFSDSQIKQKLIQFITGNIKQSKRKTSVLQRQVQTLTNQLQQEKKKLLVVESTVTLLKQKNRLAEAEYEKQIKAKLSQIQITSAMSKKKETELLQANLNIEKLESKLKQKQIIFQHNLIEFQTLKKQKEKLALALSFNQDASIIQILQQMLKKMDIFIPQRNPHISDDVWIETLVQQIQAKRKRKAIKGGEDEQNSDEDDQRKPRKMKIILKSGNQGSQIQVQTPQISISANSGPPPPPPPPPQPQRIQEVGSVFQNRKQLEEQYRLSQINNQKMRDDLKYLSKFLSQFEAIFIVLVGKLVSLLRKCEKYAKQIQAMPVSQQKKTIVMKFTEFVNQNALWVVKIFKQIKFEDFIKDYAQVKYRLMQYSQGLGKGVYLISGRHPTGLQLKQTIDVVIDHLRQHS